MNNGMDDMDDIDDVEDERSSISSDTGCPPELMRHHDRNRFPFSGHG
jgi:hypothetical protein